MAVQGTCNLSFLQACLGGRKKTVEQFLKDDENIDIYYEDPETKKSIIHTLCEGGKTDILEVIWSKKKYQDIKDSTTGNTPLFTAISLSNIPLIKLLLKHGATNDILNNGCSPFLFACSSSSVEVVKLLLKHWKIDRMSSAAMAFAGSRALQSRQNRSNRALHNPEDFFKFLLSEEFCVNSQDENGWTCLHFVAVSGNMKLLHLLMEFNCQLNIRSTKETFIEDVKIPANMSPLHVAILFKRYSMVRLFKKLDGVDFDLGKEVTIAMENEDQEMASILVEYSYCNEVPECSLLTACLEKNFFKTASSLIEHGCTDLLSLQSFQSEQLDGNWLHKVLNCCRKPQEPGLKRILELLLKNKCSLSTQDSNGNMPLHLFIHVIQKYKQSNRKKINDGLSFNILKSLTDREAINFANKDGDTPLLFALKHLRYFTYRKGFSQNTIVWLLENGADVNRINNDGNTCLHLWASDFSNRYNTNFTLGLFKSSKVVNMKNNDGLTPLHYCLKKICHMYSNDQGTLYIKNLLKRGAHLLSIDSTGATSLQELASKKTNMLMEVLENSMFETVEGSKTCRDFINLKCPDTCFKGLTPLQIALSEGCILYVNTFLRAGSNVHLSDASGFTSLPWLLKMMSNNFRNTGIMYHSPRNVVVKDLFQCMLDLITAGAPNDLTTYQKDASIRQCEVLLLKLDFQLFKNLVRAGYRFDINNILLHVSSDTSVNLGDVTMVAEHYRLPSLEHLTIRALRQCLQPNAWVACEELQIPQLIINRHFDDYSIRYK